MSVYTINTPYPSKILHIISGDSESLVKTGNALDDDSNEISSNSTIDFDVQRYLGGPIRSPGRNIHVIATVMAARFPFSFYTTDNRNNNVWIYWEGNQNSGTVTSDDAKLLQPYEQVEKINRLGSIPSFEDDGLPNGTYEWHELIDMLNDVFASYEGKGITLAERQRYPLYWLKNYRFVRTEIQHPDYEVPVNQMTKPPSTTAVFFNSAKNTYYVPLVQKKNTPAEDQINKLTFMFRHPMDRVDPAITPSQREAAKALTERAAHFQFGMRRVDEATIEPYVYDNQNPVRVEDKNRLITKYPMSHLGGLFEQIYVRADFLSRVSNQTNVLQTVPVQTNRFNEIIFQGGVNSTPRMLNLQNPNIVKIRLDVTDRMNTLLNFRMGNWALTVRFDYVRQDTPRLQSVFSPAAQLAVAKRRRLEAEDRAARGLNEDDDGQDLNPTEMDNYDVPRNPATTRFSRLLG